MIEGNSTMSSFKYILINGYGWSGSSALVDFMREFRGIYVPNKEFRIIKDPHGIRDLDNAICNSTDALNEDNAITEFIEFIKVYTRATKGWAPIGLAYSQDFGSGFYDLSMEYVKQIVDYTYSGYWWYLDIRTSRIKYLLYRLLNKIHIYDHREKTAMKLTLKNEKEFIELTRHYLDCIFQTLLKGKNYDTVVLDQAIPANRPSWGERYFENCRVLVIDRDPRDVYIDLIKEKSLVGYDIAEHHDVQLYIDWYRKVRRPESQNADYMKIQFEDLIMNYENTIKDIYNYCDIPCVLHEHKGDKLKPEVSKKNIGMWRDYGYPDEIKQIEQQLSEYLVQ